MKRFFPALVLALVIVATAPFIGLLRHALFDAFPIAAVAVLATTLALLAAGVFIYSVSRIRSYRRWRYGALVFAGTLLWLGGHGFASYDAEVTLVEKIHIVLYGLLAVLLYRALAPRRRSCGPELIIVPLLGVTLVGVFDEWTQFLVAIRLGDAKDIGLDLYSGVCGVLIALSLELPRELRWRTPHWGRILQLTAVVTLFFGLFYSEAHLGYLIEDPRIGAFRSWHSPEELLEAAADRAERWAENPPTEFRPWHLEDHYLTEAGWHAGHRDRNQEMGYAYWVWQANLILELYYRPYLDLEDFRGRPSRRYPAATLERLAESAPVFDPALYVSPVLRQRIRTWPPKEPFRALVVAVASALALLSWKLGRKKPPVTEDRAPSPVDGILDSPPRETTRKD